MGCGGSSRKFARLLDDGGGMEGDGGGLMIVRRLADRNSNDQQGYSRANLSPAPIFAPERG
jgi:hypothetical protein